MLSGALVILQLTNGVQVSNSIGIRKMCAPYSLLRTPRGFSKSGQRVISGEHERKKDEFLTNFVHLPPENRVMAWLRAGTRDGATEMYAGARGDLSQVLTAGETDTIPYLEKVVRKGSLKDRIDAVRILCDMDRFVPAQADDFPGEGATIRLKSINLEGSINPFLSVEGRRIGREGYDLIHWAAEQNSDDELHFYARLFAGLLRQDLQGLSLDEQIDRWRKAIIESKGVTSSDSQAYFVYWTLDQILIEKIPDSLPRLLKMLEADRDGYVREGLVELLAQADLCRMRLRGTELGRQATNMIQKTLRDGNLKPVYKDGKRRREYWNALSGQFFHDDVRLDTGSTWALYARTFEDVYGEKTTRTINMGELHLVEAVPEVRKFISFLTASDPYFPSWEYTYCGRSPDEVFHPRFKVKIARYHEQWERFKKKAEK
jgi:hypothetical protein